MADHRGEYQETAATEVKIMTTEMRNQFGGIQKTAITEITTVETASTEVRH